MECARPQSESFCCLLVCVWFVCHKWAPITVWRRLLSAVLLVVVVYYSVASAHQPIVHPYAVALLSPLALLLAGCFDSDRLLPAAFVGALYLVLGSVCLFLARCSALVRRGDKICGEMSAGRCYASIWLHAVVHALLVWYTLLVTALIYKLYKTPTQSTQPTASTKDTKPQRY